MSRFLNNLGARQATVAVDFGLDAVRVAVLRIAAGGGMEVQQAFTLPPVDLAHGVPQSMMQSFAARIRSAGVSGCRARITLPAPAFQSEIATLPSLEASELAASARFEAIGRLGVDESSTIIRHLTLGGTADARQVLLLTLPMHTARHAVEMAVAAGLQPESVEHAAFASLRGACLRQPEAGSGFTALLHVEPRSATIVLFREGRTMFLRSLRGEWVMSAPRTSAPITLQDGDIPLEPADDASVWRWSSLSEETLRCLRQGCGEAAWPDRLVLTGVVAADRTLVEALGGVCGMPVQTAGCANWVRASAEIDAGWASCLGAGLREGHETLSEGEACSPLVDFLQVSVRREAVAKLARRRTGLLAALMIALSALAGMHSWNRARAAQADLDLETRMYQQASNIDELWDRLAAEHQALRHGLEVTDGLTPAVQASQVIAAISRAMPEQVMVGGLRVEREDSPRRLQVTMQGFGASGQEVAHFQQRLADCPMFQSVTLSERRTGEMAGRRGEAFSLTIQVSLEVTLEPAAPQLKVAMGGSR